MRSPSTKRKLLCGAALLVLFLAILAVMSVSTAKRAVPSDAIKVLMVEVNNYANPTVAGEVSGLMVISNTTLKILTVEFVSMQAGDGVWTNVDDLIAHGGVTKLWPGSQTFEFLTFAKLPPPRPRRFRFRVCEELRGSERIISGTEVYAEDLIGKLRNRRTAPLRPWVVMNRGAQVFGHRTEIIVGEDWPKFADGPLQ